MKRIATLAVILLMSLTASAHSIRYFTESQAVRTVRYLNAQNEMMIYCGYDYEIETYVLINEVWMERVNSAYYEIWVFGFDAYTGDEIYMPLDLGCVWLFSAGRIYNAAQYLRFHSTARMPHFTWYIPPYNPYTRMMHRPGYVRSYHYDIHRHGWMPPAYHHHHGATPPLPPYYMRQPNTPAPRPSGTWTPGTDRPVVAPPSTEGRTGTAGRVTTGGNNGGSSSGTRTGANDRGSGTATGTTNTRGTGTATGTTNTRGTGTTSGTTNTRGTGTSASGTTNTRGTGTATSSSTGRGSGTTSGTTNTRSSGSRTSGTTPTRSNTSAATSSSRSANNEAASRTTTEKPKTTTTRGTNNTSRGTGSASSGSRTNPSTR